MESEKQADLGRLAPLLGEWAGRGRGSYPTLDPFVFADRVVIRARPDSGYLTYEQSTELLDRAGRSVRNSHWEAGILRPLEDGRVELDCVQGGGRLEVLRGELAGSDTRPESLRIRFLSAMIANDSRVLSSSRTWTLAGDRFEYVMEMATTAVEELTFHVEASLEKVR